MKIVNVIGGLGNQMFQVAFALAIKWNSPDEDVLIDIQQFRHPFVKSFRGVNFCHNGYEVDNYFLKASLPIASALQVAKVSYYLPNYLLNRICRKILPQRKSEFKQFNSYIFNPKVFDIKEDCYFEGYWQHYKYYVGIRDNLIQAFQFPIPNENNSKTADIIKLTASIGIHVRRGDYVNNRGFGGVCNLEYYLKALKLVEITPETHFFIFSNDIEWCEENLRPLMKNVTYVDWNQGKDSPWDMFLMSQCKQLIIANSSFSWWGAFLNQQASKIVAPKTWNKLVTDMHIQMPDWTLI